MLVLNERHQVDVVLAADDEDAPVGVTVGVRVFEDVEQVPRSIWKTTSSNPMPRSALSFAFFASSQAKYFTAISVAQRVPVRHTLASAPVCPPVCPNAVRRPSSGIQRQPSYQKKTGLKSPISGPSCDFWQPQQTAAFSLSATSPQTLSIREISTCQIQLFLSDLQRFFKPSPSSTSARKSPDFTMRDPQTLGTLAKRHGESRARGWRALCVVSVLRWVGVRVPMITASRVPNQTTSAAEPAAGRASFASVYLPRHILQPSAILIS